MVQKLTKADIVEMIECYEFYLDTHCPMTYADVAFVFDVSPATVKKIFSGTHPLCDDYKKPAAVPKKPGRKKGFSSHCKQGHEMSGDNLYEYVDNKGVYSRRCRLCQKARMKTWRIKQ
jgi:hypothetical protein